MSLALLYAKAAVTAVGPRASDLPATVLRREVVVDRAHLAAYDRVCGFRYGDALPLPYPHVLGFGLQVELMASRAFPFALPGLVHVRNTIVAHRPLDAAEPLALAVHAERLRAHPKGAQVNLVTVAEVGGETVWEGRSTYFSRGATAPDAGADRAAGPGPAAPVGSAAGAEPTVPAGTAAGPGPAASAEIAAGAEPGAPGEIAAGIAAGFEPAAPAEIEAGPPAALWRVDGGTGRRYARVSGDVNPIHLSPVTAKAFGFPRAIAHGMWTAAHALAAVSGRLPEALTWDVAFGKPLLLPSTVELRTRPVDGGWDLDVRSPGGPGHLTAAVRPA